MDFSRLRDRRVLIAAGAGGLALLAALGIGIGALVRHAGHSAPEAEELAESSVRGSLQVEMGSGDPGLDLTRPLRCFVGGQFVGMLTLQECARRNGVEAGQLDVGIDNSGEVAAASSSADVLQPLPAAPGAEAVAPPAAPAPQAAPEEAQPDREAAGGEVGACWRYAGDWRKLDDDVSLDACIQTLFAGKCVRPGGADYGRWGDDTLRLVAGRVERQLAGGGFRTVVRQPPGDCAIPHLQE